MFVYLCWHLRSFESPGTHQQRCTHHGGELGNMPRLPTSTPPPLHSTPFLFETVFHHMGVSKNRVNPQIIPFLKGFSIINHPFWGTSILGNTHIMIRNASLFFGWTIPILFSMPQAHFFPEFSRQHTTI